MSLSRDPSRLVNVEPPSIPQSSSKYMSLFITKTRFCNSDVPGFWKSSNVKQNSLKKKFVQLLFWYSIRSRPPSQLSQIPEGRTDMSRPPTRSGSRPNTQDGLRSGQSIIAIPYMYNILVQIVQINCCCFFKIMANGFSKEK